MMGRGESVSIAKPADKCPRLELIYRGGPMRNLMLITRAVVGCLALWATSNVALAITLAPFTNFFFNNPIGIDFHEPTNQLIMSVNYPTGSPHNFDLVAPGGTPTQFGPVAGLTEEV